MPRKWMCPRHRYHVPLTGSPQGRPPSTASLPKKHRRRVLGGFTVVVLVWLAVAGFQLVAAASAARRGMDATNALRQVASEDLTDLADSLDGTNDDVAEETAAEALRRAADDFSDANGRVGSPWVRPLYLLPVLGRQLRSVDALSAAAAITASEAASAVSELESILTSSTATGANRLDAIARSQQVLTTLQAGIDDLDLGPTEGLLGPLADAHNRFAREYNRVNETLDSTLTAVIGLREFLTGPTDYLLLAANNAEMRAGSGMYLQAGELETHDGGFVVDELLPTPDLVLAESIDSLDDDIESLWGVLEPGREWRNVNLSPRFDATAAGAADMWSARTGREPDGVVALDVIGVRRLVELTGPVTLDSGETVSAETVERDLLVDQYSRYGEDRYARRDRLGQVAGAVLEAINTRAVSASELLDAIRDLGAGRHLLMWSSHPTQQDAWVALGTDGAVPADALMLSVMNRGGNKLDPYLRVSSVVTSSTDSGFRHLTVEVTTENHAPSNLPHYVAGPYPGTDLVAGEYRGILALTIPGPAGNIIVSGDPPAALGTDGVSNLAAIEIRLRPGESRTTRFDFDITEAQQHMVVLPSARVPPTTWTFGPVSFNDDAAHSVDLDAIG